MCLFVAVFLLYPWFNQLWGVSLTDPLTLAYAAIRRPYVHMQEGWSIVPTVRKL